MIETVCPAVELVDTSPDPERFFKETELEAPVRSSVPLVSVTDDESAIEPESPSKLSVPVVSVVAPV